MRILLILFLVINLSSFSQTDSLIDNEKWKGEHQIFAEGFGVGLHASIGYSYAWTQSHFSIAPIVGLGGVLSKHIPFRAFVPYVGINLGYKINRLFRFNLTCIGASYNSFYGIFGSNKYCIEENVNCPDKTINYISFGINMDVKLNERFDLNIGLYKPYKIYSIKYIPSIKLKLWL